MAPDGETTLGTPICILVRNKDQKSQDYSEMEKAYRPSHADATYDFKYGIRAVAGGGRSSARETIGRVAAGAIAKKLLKEVAGTEVLAYVNRVRDVESNVNHDALTMDAIESNPVRCPDEAAAELMYKGMCGRFQFQLFCYTCPNPDGIESCYFLQPLMRSEQEESPVEERSPAW